MGTWSWADLPVYPVTVFLSRWVRVLGNPFSAFICLLPTWVAHAQHQVNSGCLTPTINAWAFSPGESDLPQLPAILCLPVPSPVCEKLLGPCGVGWTLGSRGGRNPGF